MKKSTKKLVSVLLASAMAAGMLAGCGSGNGKGSTGDSKSSSAASGTSGDNLSADTSEHVDLTMYLIGDRTPDFDEVYAKINEILEEKLNCSLNVEFLSWGEHDTKYSLLFSSQEDFDLIFTASSWCHYEQTVSLGGFAPLSEDFIKTYAPDIWEVVPEMAWEQAKIDGQIYMVPSYANEFGQEVLAVRGDLMEKYGMDDITSWDDLMKFYKACAADGIYASQGGPWYPFFQSQGYSTTGGDLNGNGEDDEIPMATWFGATDTFGSYNLFYRFTGAFGCADSYCGGNSYADHLRMVDGKVTFTATDEAFKKTAEFFNMLYEEGLIWNGSFEADESMSFKSSLIKENVAKIGSFGVWGDQEITNQEVHDQYVAVPRLQGEDGMTGFECNYSELQDSSDTAITTTCKFPHVVARFVDYMVGDPEISVTSNWGAIGYNYEKDEDGVLRTPLDENGNYKPLNPEYKNFGEARVNSTTCRGSMIVQNEYYDTVCGYTFDAVKLLEMQKENGKDDIMEEYDTIPRVLMTQEEIQRLAQIQPTVSDIVDRYITTWVTGGVDDASWESYKTELEGAGLSELVEIYQGAVDRAASAAN